MHAMVKRWVLAGTVVLMGVGGCASTGTGQTSTNSNTPRTRPSTPTGHLIEPGPASELGYRINWSRDMDMTRNQRITSAVILDDLLLTVEQPENFLTARSVRDGQLKWKIKLGSRLERFFAPVRDGEEIYINSQTRIFVIHANSGDVLAVADLDSTVDSSPYYDPETGLAIFGGSNGLVFAHSIDNNFARWRYQLPGRISATPVRTDRDVFVIDDQGNYVMLQLNSGRIQWRNRTLGHVVAAPTVQGNDVLIASMDRKLYALNRTSGRDAWVYLGGERPLSAAPIALGRTVVLPLPPDGGIVALNSLNGEERWRSDLNAKPVVERDRDLVLHTERNLLLMDLEDGETLVDAPTLPLQMVIPGPNDSLILISPRGRLLRLNRIGG